MIKDFCVSQRLLETSLEPGLRCSDVLLQDGPSLVRLESHSRSIENGKTKSQILCLGLCGTLNSGAYSHLVCWNVENL